MDVDEKIDGKRYEMKELFEYVEGNTVTFDFSGTALNLIFWAFDKVTDYEVEVLVKHKEQEHVSYTKTVHICETLKKKQLSYGKSFPVNIFGTENIFKDNDDYVCLVAVKKGKPYFGYEYSIYNDIVTPADNSIIPIGGIHWVQYMHAYTWEDIFEGRWKIEPKNKYADIKEMISDNWSNSPTELCNKNGTESIISGKLGFYDIETDQWYLSGPLASPKDKTSEWNSCIDQTMLCSHSDDQGASYLPQHPVKITPVKDEYVMVETYGGWLEYHDIEPYTLVNDKYERYNK